MERNLLFFIVAFLCSYNCYSQLACQTPPRQSQAISGSQPNNCDQLLHDVVPSLNDSVLEVKVKMWVFTPPTGIGTWDTCTLSRAQYAIDYVNALFEDFDSPTLPMTSPTVPYLKRSRIKFVLSSFNKIMHDSLYNNAYLIGSEISNVVYMHPTYNALGYINVVYAGAQPNGVDNFGNPAWRIGVETRPLELNNLITFFHGIPGSGAQDDIGREYCKRTLAHELGHALGLEHSIDTSSIKPTFGCCKQINADDFVKESPLDPDCFHGGTNNLMYCCDSWCQRYLSPEQMAIMHYNLRTNRIQYLTSASYIKATSVNHAYDYNVTTNETWDTGDRYMKGDVIVKAGKKLTIKCGVAMTYGAKIVVEKAALLVVDGGTITNISDRSWDGIHVCGDPTKSQAMSTTNPGFAQFQGVARFMNGARISKANIGVRNHYLGTNTSNMTGIIIAVNSNFVNNYIDVQLLGNSSSTAQIASASRFYGCSFRIDGPLGGNGNPITRVNLYNSKGSGFYGCTFQYNNSNPGNQQKGDGIKSVNSSCDIDNWGSTNTIIRNFSKGVFINNWNPMLTPLIRRTKFESNMTHLYAMNANYLTFKTNTVQFGNFNSLAGGGVYLNNCKYYKINNNQFIQGNTSVGQGDPGISVYKSMTGTHEIFANTFKYLYMGVNVMDDNGNPNPALDQDGLKINCNIFNLSHNKYDVVLSHTTGLNPPRVAKVQGKTTSGALPKQLVRNLYGAECGGSYGSTEAMWKISSYNPSQVLHGANTNTPVTGVTQPPIGCKSSPLSVVPLNTPLDYAADCLGDLQSSGGGGVNISQKLENMNSYINDLKNDNTENKNHFEIQSTVASKMNLFLTDTLGPQLDSVIALLQNNQGNMEDADLQLVYAYMAAGNLVVAANAVDALTGSRADWKVLLDKVIELQGDTSQGIQRLKTVSDERTLFWNYSTSDTLEGRALAQALLKEACDSSYTEPHALPDGEGARPDYTTGLFQTSTGSFVEMFPNPTQSGVTVRYSGDFSQPVWIELKDLLGKEIFVKFIQQGFQETFVPMEQLSKGVYLLSLIRGKELIYKNKIVKQD